MRMRQREVENGDFSLHTFSYYFDFNQISGLIINTYTHLPQAVEQIEKILKPFFRFQSICVVPICPLVTFLQGDKPQ